VIAIKDNTIEGLKAEFGVRSSIAEQPSKDQDTKDVACLAHPETRDVKSQTHGPRRQSYYKSIPPKVNTNLPNRSPNSSLEHENSNHIITPKTTALGL